jgi:hypothetical protein
MGAMMKSIAYLLAWSLYGIGHGWSRMAGLFPDSWDAPLFGWFLYRPYNRLMMWSCELSDHYKLEIWK